MDKEYISWHNENTYRDYPLVSNTVVPKSFILDATIWLTPPVILKVISFKENEIEFRLSNDVYWNYPRSSTKIYTYNDYGKLVVTREDILSVPLGTVLECNVSFLDTVCTKYHDLRLASLTGGIEIVGRIERDGQSLLLTFPETPVFDYNCVSSINGQAITNNHLAVTGDKCTKVFMQQGQFAVHDECLPPCYNCNERLVEGDVKITTDILEARIRALE